MKKQPPSIPNTFHTSLSFDTHGHATCGGQLEVGSVMEGKGLYLAEKGSDDITSSFVAIGSNLFSS